jgi:hypothetical protein
VTAQVSDTVRYGGLNYSLAGVRGEGLFDPLQQGIAPSGISSDCWRGYYCTYAVEDDCLLLDRLHVGLGKDDAALAKTGNGPAIQSVLPRYDVREHCWEYSLLRITIGFTGGLLLGREYMHELYVHMGFHPAWKYGQVHELVFDNGRLIEGYDRSAQVEDFRSHLTAADLKPGPSASKQEIADWIERTFSLHYDR